MDITPLITQKETLVNTTYQDKNFCIIDDIYATGNTMKAIQRAMFLLFLII